jgi:hypothetical protein
VAPFSSVKASIAQIVAAPSGRVVGVKRLLGFAWQNVDRLQLRQQVVRLENPVETTEDQRVLHQWIADQRLLEEGVQTLRLEALEVVAAGFELEARNEVFFDLGNQVRRNQVLDDHVAITFHGLHAPVDLLDRRFRLRPCSRGVLLCELDLRVLLDVPNYDASHGAKSLQQPTESVNGTRGLLDLRLTHGRVIRVAV